MEAATKKVKITLELLKELFDGDGHDAIRYVRENYVSYPDLPQKPHLNSKHTALEAKEYAKSLSLYETEMLIYTKLKKEIQKSNFEADEVLEIFLKETSGLNKYVPADKRDKVWYKAWEDGHSSGYGEVYTILISLVELFE